MAARPLVLILALAVFCAYAEELKVPPRIADPRFARDYNKADEYIRNVVDAHEREFPGAFKYKFLYYYTSLKRLSNIQQGLVAELSQSPEFQEGLAKREPMTDMKITALKDFRSGNGDDFRKNDWQEFKKSLQRNIDPEMPMPEVLGRLEDDVISEFNKFDWEHAGALHRSLTKFIMVASIAKSLPPDGTTKHLLKRISQIEPASLDYIKDGLHYMPILKKIRKSVFDQEKTSLDEIENHIAGIQEDLEYKFWNENISINLKSGSSIQIREVHPNLSILRGFVGNDCSTLISPGFVFTPYDRYYYVFDEGGNSLGYVGLSRVKIGGEPALYLHTIQGPDFTAEQVQLVMKGFQAAKETFGASKVVLAKDENIYKTVNFRPIVKTMMAAVANQPEQRVTWLDHKYRRLIIKWDSSLDYDDPNQNQFGRELQFDPADVAVAISQHPFVAKFETPLKSCDELLQKGNKPRKLGFFKSLFSLITE